MISDHSSVIFSNAHVFFFFSQTHVYGQSNKNPNDPLTDGG